MVWVILGVDRDVPGLHSCPRLEFHLGVERRDDGGQLGLNSDDEESKVG